MGALAVFTGGNGRGRAASRGDICLGDVSEGAAGGRVEGGGWLGRKMDFLGPAGIDGAEPAGTEE